MALKICIIDDENQIRKFLKLSLEAHEYSIIEAGTGREGFELTRSELPDCVILDLSLPDMDGLQVLKMIRESSSVPVIILSVRNSENDKIELLDAGANDYLTKPFGIGELLARIRAVMRIVSPGAAHENFRNGSLSVDFAKRSVTVAGKDVRLTPTEFSILGILARNAGKVVMYNTIVREIWGSAANPDESYLRVYILQIRRKIEADPANPEIIITEPGVGYRMLVAE